MTGDKYWSGVADSAGGHIAYPAWRRYCDALHGSLLRKWLSEARFRTALKTDLFDEACGEGMFSDLERIAERVWGLDISRNIAERAARRHPSMSVAVEDVRGMTVRSESVEFVLSNSTLDHFTEASDLEKSLSEIVRILAPGGVLLLTLDNPLNPVVAVRNRMPAGLFGRTAFAPYFVGHTLSLGSATQVLESLGCVISQKGYIMHVPRILFLHLCRWFDPESRCGRWFLRFMAGFEMLARLPSARFTGHFVAVLAIKKA